MRVSSILLLCGTVAGAGCGLLDTSVRPPPAPEGFPQPGDYEDGKAELVVDGEMYVSEYSTGASYNVEGGYEDQLRVSLELDDLELDFRDLETGTFTISSGDLEAEWYSGGTFRADGGCGDGRIEVLGLRGYDSGLYGDRDFIWGTVQLTLCRDVSDMIVTTEVTGRFTAVVDYT
jgi:hypothetical protein